MQTKDRQVDSVERSLSSLAGAVKWRGAGEGPRDSSGVY